MNAALIVNRLEQFGKTLPGVVGGMRLEDMRWKPPSGNWSILEILCHLADEEVEDFRARLAFILEQRQGAPPGIDPEGWAAARAYNEQKPQDVLERFVRERERSVTWLHSLSLATTDWKLAYVHPKLGPLHAGDLLAAWAAHDALHLRQIAKRMHEMAARDAAGFSVRYAGEWGA